MDREFKYNVHARMWISKGDRCFLGLGRITLLDYIDRTGSISEAARCMKMSYRHAWELVDSMNSHAPQPLVKKMTGGKGGGGTKLTQCGKAVLTLYRQALSKVEGVLSDLEIQVNRKISEISNNDNE